jgi:hypothetical protein
MEEHEALEVLAKAGLDVEAPCKTWSDSIRLLAALESMGRDGANALVKIDGGRTNERLYTVVVSGGRLKEDFFRKDGSELLPMLREAVIDYAKCVQKRN